MGRASDKDEIRRERAETHGKDRVGEALAWLDRMCSESYTGEYNLQVVKLRLGITDEVETLCIVEALGPDGGPVVGFNGAQTPTEALVGAVNRIKNGAMKWKVDGFKAK